MTTPIWMRAIEDHIGTIELMQDIAPERRINYALLKQTGPMFKRASPFAWSHESIQAVVAASKSIPPNTKFNAWNVDTNAVWWWFEEELPWKTLEIKNNRILSSIGVRAVMFGWISQERSFPPGTSVEKIMEFVDNPSLVCSTWVDANGTMGRHPLAPSQTWLWEPFETLAGALERNEQLYRDFYGNKFDNSGGLDQFMKMTEGLSRFILAGMVWIKQRVLTLEPGHIERHRRKALNKLMLKPVSDVKVVCLRRVHPESGDGKDRTIEWTRRWLVDGHWRNQRVGPGRQEMRLTYVHPYIKGPEDKPFVEPKRTVYLVNR